MNNSNTLAKEGLGNLKAIRRQANRLLDLARQNKLKYFALDEQQWSATTNFVCEIIKDNYPDLKIPYHSRWRHFEAGGNDRIKFLQKQISYLPLEEQGKIFYELVIISVLLDAGSGSDWSYFEKRTGQHFTRSEGLAVASLDLYLSGAFSADPAQPFRVDSEKLIAFDENTLKTAFQINKDNPLTGVQGRVSLLNRLGLAIEKQSDFFGDEGRLGSFYHYIFLLQSGHEITAKTIFQAVLTAFRDIWPNRPQYQNNLAGDVWIHQALKTDKDASELVPFHKLSQWLSYSLIEPLEWAGVTVKQINDLTGLPEYRNGGLFIDMGLLKVKNKDILLKPQAVGAESIVEWRALTLALLDELAQRIREQLGFNSTELPLTKVLQGGTWDAGRQIAKQKRSDGTPPIKIISDGTVF